MRPEEDLRRRGQHSLGYRQRAEEIRVKDAAHDVNARLARRAVVAIGDARIVHQHIEAGVVSLDGSRGSLTRFRLTEIDVDETNVDTLGFERCGRRFTQRGIAGAE
jgi:hypothetical protein